MKPKLKKIPDDDWYCTECKPKMRIRSPKKKHGKVFEEEEPEEEPEEPEREPEEEPEEPGREPEAEPERETSTVGSSSSPERSGADAAFCSRSR